MCATPPHPQFRYKTWLSSQSQTDRREDVMQCPEATGPQTRKIFEIGGRFFFCIKLVIWIKCATLTQLCDTWLNWPHCTIIISLSPRHNSVQYFNPTNSAFFFFFANTTCNYSPILSAPRDYSTVQLPWHTVACELFSIITLFSSAQYHLQCS